MKPTLGLQDIQGLDAISRWPLAMGWWILLGLVVIAIITTAAIYIRRQAKLRGWRYRTLKILGQLEMSLSPENSQATAIELSNLVRRLAIQRYSRQECASLKGDVWLAWLSERDAAKFNWLDSSRCLTEAPFRQPGAAMDPQALRKTITAAKGWVQ